MDTRDTNNSPGPEPVQGKRRRIGTPDGAADSDCPGLFRRHRYRFRFQS